MELTKEQVIQAFMEYIDTLEFEGYDVSWGSYFNENNGTGGERMDSGFTFRIATKWDVGLNLAEDF